MSDELDFTLEVAKDSMIKAITHLENELTKIRAGKANPQMLEGVTVDYYGVATIISQMANVSAIDARTLTIQPWEKNMLQPLKEPSSMRIWVSLHKMMVTPFDFLCLR